MISLINYPTLISSDWELQAGISIDGLACFQLRVKIGLLIFGPHYAYEHKGWVYDLDEELEIEFLTRATLEVL